MGSQTQFKPDYVLTPLPDDGTRGYRVELDEFMADNDMVNLFLIALRAMQLQSLEPTDKGKMNLLKFYALAAVHGRPSEDWNNYPNKPIDNSSSQYGYCHHGLDTFPTWHRPYMMMYERAIYEEMVTQANKYDFSNKSKYRAAAERFRLPYFDPIMPRYKWDGTNLQDVWGVPEILRTGNVWVRTSEKPEELTTIPNPLYSFVFPTPDEFQKSGRKKLVMNPKSYNQTKTIRAPTTIDKSNDTELEARFKNQGVGLAVSLWQMLSPDFRDANKVEVNAIRPWSSFANHSFVNKGFKDENGRTVANVSIESWHDGIHDAIGRGRNGFSGQMGNPEYAGFDPIFWMHHNNIDRLLALHQAMYGQKMDAQTAALELRPFAKDADGTCWKSTDSLVTDYWSPGFAVPGNKKSDPATIKQTVSQYITETYYWAINNAGDSSILKDWPKPMKYSEALRGKAAEKRDTPTVGVTAVSAKTASLVHREVSVVPQKKLAFDDEPIDAESTLARVAAIADAVPDKAYWTPEQRQAAITESWNAHIRVRKFAFNRSFAVEVFIGHVDNDQAEHYLTQDNEVGFSGIFASGEDYAESCSSCQQNRDRDLIYEDVVPLTTKLTDYLTSNPKSAGLIQGGGHRTIDTLEPDDVVPFLREHLRWRMVDINGSLLSGQEQMAQLEVTITGRDYIAPTPEHIMGQYGEPTVYPEITSTKAGGFGHVYT